jgi:hypothetical protein
MLILSNVRNIAHYTAPNIAAQKALFRTHATSVLLRRYHVIRGRIKDSTK